MTSQRQPDDGPLRRGTIGYPGFSGYSPAGGLPKNGGALGHDEDEAGERVVGGAERRRPQALRPQIEAALPFEQVREALQRVGGRHTRGKVVLQIG